MNALTFMNGWAMVWAAVMGEEQPNPVLAVGIEKFDTRMTRGEPHDGPNGFRHVPIEVVWGWDQSAAVQFLCLPFSLPDDRTDRTKIELLP